VATVKQKSGPISLTLAFTSDIKNTQLAWKTIEETIKASAYSEEKLLGFRLSLGEAVANAIKHGNQHNPRKIVTITFQIYLTEIKTCVADEGKGYDPDQVPDPLAPENIERDSGRGLLLIRHYASQVTIHPPGNQLTMVHKIL